MKKVALLDGQSIQALPVAESLKKSGYYTILFCDTKQSYGYRTKYGDKKVLCPSTQTNIKEFHKFFIQFLEQEKIDVLIPLNDYSAHYLSFHSETLKKYAKFLIPSLDIFLNGYDKSKLMSTCQKHNYPHPKTFDIEVGNINVASECVGFPALIKPNYTTGARGFAIVNSAEEIQERLPTIIEKYGACHIQEFIPEGGRQFKVEIFIMNKELINSTVIHKMRFYPEKGGSSCFNQTVRRNDLVALCFEVLKTIAWEGFADLDLIEDPRDGIIKIMEINPRIPACIRASFNAGVDFAENIVQASLGESTTRYEYIPGKYLRYFSLDMLWFLKSKNRFKAKPSWFTALLSPKQYLQDGSLKDIKPFIYGTIGGLLKQLNPQFRAAKKGMNT